MTYSPGDDEERPPTMWCSRCKCNVDTTIVDNGFDYEYGSIRGYHHQDDLACAECGDDVEEAHEEEEEEEEEEHA